MKQQLIYSLALVILLAIGCHSPSFSPADAVSYEAVQVETGRQEAVQPAETGQPSTAVIPETPVLAPSCADPTPEMAPACQAQVEQILNATVRIELEYGLAEHPVAENGRTGNQALEVTSHATLVNQRYLITHNHFPISLREINEGTSEPLLHFSLYTLQGETILQSASLRNFEVVAEWPETLVLDFRESGEVLFKAFGVRSVPVATMATADLQVGMEVAQINWDGVNTWVEWVRIERIAEEQGITQIVLNRGVRTGASGGGVFWNGRHVGNNWTTSQVREIQDGAVVATFSVAAFNIEMPFAS